MADGDKGCIEMEMAQKDDYDKKWLCMFGTHEKMLL